MKKNFLQLIVLMCFVPFSLGVSGQSTYKFEVNTKKIGAPIQSTMYGQFFEDINFGADGGLYGELVKNRSFDFPQHFMGWYTFGKVAISTESAPFNRNPNYVILNEASHPHKQTGIENEGFRGMGFKEGNSYRFTVWGKSIKGEEQTIRVELLDPHYHILGSEKVIIKANEWSKYEVIIKSNKTEPKGRLRVFLESKGPLALEHVSLFPVDTYKGRENGLRKDLAQALEDMSPGIFRFPGGCIVEGTEIHDRYDWKKTVGIVENRPVNKNRWEYTFKNRYFPDYYQSYGLGFYEYFLLAEDMGAEPLPVVNCGLTCQYQNEHEECYVAVEDLGPYIQDALDLIEFANGPTTSTWGGLRAEMGHPEPFNLKFIGIGNEQWGEAYTKRLEPFVKALRAKYPEIKIIGSSGPKADGKEFDYLWPEMKKLKVDLVDEHYYQSPEWFLSNASRYDNYDRKGPAVFAGEYACHMPKGKANNFASALYEAAFMTGLERNADIVHMCTYAPLFAHVDAWQWRPDMIWFDNMRVMKTPNYYVQQMYAQNVGTHVVSLTSNKKPVTGDDGLYASAVYDKNNQSYIVKIVNTEAKAKKVAIDFKGFKKASEADVELLVFQNENLKAENSLDNPNQVVPKTLQPTRFVGNEFLVDVDPQTFIVYKVKQQK